MVGSQKEAKVAVWTAVWARVSYMSIANDCNVDLKNNFKFEKYSFLVRKLFLGLK